MYERDYLMRQIMQLMIAISESMNKAQRDADPAAAAERLEEAIGLAADIDGPTLLSLAPDSLVSVFLVANMDMRVSEYIAHSLAVEADYLREAGDAARASLRQAQSEALAQAFGIDMNTSLEELLEDEEF